MITEEMILAAGGVRVWTPTKLGKTYWHSSSDDEPKRLLVALVETPYRPEPHFKEITHEGDLRGLRKGLMSFTCYSLGAKAIAKLKEMADAE